MWNRCNNSLFAHGHRLGVATFTGQLAYKTRNQSPNSRSWCSSVKASCLIVYPNPFLCQSFREHQCREQIWYKFWRQCRGLLMFAHTTHQSSLSKTCRLVSGATAYDNPISGDTYVLVFNEALHYGEKLDHTLMNPNQLRAWYPYGTMHSILCTHCPSRYTQCWPFRSEHSARRFPCAIASPRLMSYAHVNISKMTTSHPWNPTEVVMTPATV